MEGFLEWATLVDPLPRADALGYASPALKADREVVLAAVQQNGEALRFASTAVQEDAGALQYASPSPQANPWVVLASSRPTSTTTPSIAP